MCGRYTLGTFDWVDPAFHTDLASVGDLVKRPRYNIAPGQMVLALTRGAGGSTVAESMHWGVKSTWKGGPPMLINARAETLAGSGFWNALLDDGRCAIPADGFYEWRAAEGKGARKRPYWFSRTCGEGFAFAGLFQSGTGEGGTDSCAIITLEPNDLVAGVHDRMPAMLTPDQVGQWLGDDTQQALAALQPFPSTEMTARAVAPAVGNADNEGPELIEPFEEATRF
ncbi:MAG: SOS response-associated peptidase [Solirubrobacterales bacterium]